MSDILHKVSCVDGPTTVIVKPYSNSEFYLNNPFTNKPYTIDEKKIKKTTSKPM